MAKKRKGARKAAGAAKGRKKSAKGAKRASSTRRKATRTRKATVAPRKEINLTPVKQNLRSYMDQLAQVEDPRVKEALAGLETVQRQLTDICFPSMIIP